MELNEGFFVTFYGSIPALDYCNFQRSYLLCFFVSSPTNQSRKDPVPACQGKADGDPLYYWLAKACIKKFRTINKYQEDKQV